MWVNSPLSQHKLFASEKRVIILVFAFCVLLRTIPELIAYPHPIGYDVINYYIPVVENFDEHWSSVASQFPLYVLFLNSVKLATHMPAHSVVTGVAIAMFGLFGTSLFYLGRSLFRLDTVRSLFCAIFPVFHMAVLRTTWDLHRDIFALTAMFFVFSLLSRSNGKKQIVAILALAILTVGADRMMGVLLCISLIAHASITKRKEPIVIAVFATGVSVILALASYSYYVPSSNVGGSSIEVSADNATASYNPQDLLILFAVANGLLVAPAVVGFFRINNSLLQVPLLASLVGSFSWLAFPSMSQLVADRWIIVAGIFLAIFASFGILHVIKNLKPRTSLFAALSILITFAVVGIAYAVMPYDSPFVLYGIARQNIENFSPVTMQFNSIDIQDNPEILSTIEWINQNTEADAVIVGEKHWRGFMEIYLQDQRTYRFSENPQTLAEAIEKQGKAVYLITYDSRMQPMFAIEDIAIK